MYEPSTLLVKAKSFLTSFEFSAVDMLFRNEIFSLLRLVAALLVVAGFVLMMTPDSWNLPFHRCSGVTSSRCYGNEPEEDEGTTRIK